MKQHYSKFIIAILFLFGAILKAQTTPYHKLLGSNQSDWYIFMSYIPVKVAGSSNTSFINLDQGKYSAMGDTNVLSTDYKKVYHVYHNPFFQQNVLLGFIREDTIARKVYFLEESSTTEELLYDFSLTQGATTALNFQASSGNFPNGTYSVTTVDSVLTRVGYRKQFKLKSSASDTLTIIESIGSIIHPLYLYGSYYGPGYFTWGSPTCSYPYGMGLACKYSNDEKYYQSCTYTLAEMNGCIYKYDSCNYYTNCSNIEEISSKIKHRLVPNPASEKVSLELEIEKDDMVTIDVYDVSGRRVKRISNNKLYSGKNDILIDVTDFQNGYYFIKLIGMKYNLNSSLIISK